MSNLLTVFLSISLFLFFFLFFLSGLFLFSCFSQSVAFFSLFFFSFSCSLLLVCSCFLLFSSIFLCSFFSFFFSIFLLVSLLSSKCCILLPILSSAVSTIVYSKLCHVGMPDLRHQIWICCIAVIHIQTYTYVCRNKINNNNERTLFFRKIYLSHFIRNGCERFAKGLCVRG